MRNSFQKFAAIFAALLLLGCISANAQDEEAAPAEIADADAGAGKPILLMGAKYGEYDRRAIREEILIPRKLTYEDGGDWVSAENWKNYSLVIVANTMPADLSDAEYNWMRDYVNNGGRVLMLGPVIAQLRQRGNAPLDWLGFGGYQAVKEGAYEVTTAGKKYFADSAAAAAALGAVSTTGPAKLSTAQPLLTRGGNAVFLRNSFGKGEAFYLGLDYFRVGSSAPTKDRPAARVAIKAMLEKIIITGDTQTKTDAIAAGLQAYGSATPIAWRRDFAQARGAEYSTPPFPKKGDELRQINLDLGIGEGESFPIYLSSASAQPNFSIRIDDLSNETGAASSGQKVLPASSLRLRAQGVVKPELTVGPFWLLDLPRENAAKSSSWKLPLEANHSSTLWLTFSTQGLAPGEYAGKVQFQNPQLAPVQLNIKVWPVALPGREYFELEATSIWSSLLSVPGQSSYNFPDPPAKLTLFDKHIQNMAAHGVSFNADSTWSNRFGRSVSMKNVRLRDSGVLFDAALKQGLIKENALPHLDFSYFDSFIEPALLNGIPFFHFNFKNLPTDWIGYAQDISGDANLVPDSPRHEKVKRWLLTEIVSYLHSKGIRKIVAFVADEIAPDKIADAVRRAKMLRECGIETEFTATGETGQSREHIAQINPQIDRWIWNAAILPKAKSFVRSANSPIDASDQEYTYLADWHRAPYIFNRARGPFCAFNDLDGLMIHGYLRWYPNGGAVYNTENGPVDTEGWEGARDGVEDARYWKRLSFLLQAASQKPALAADVKRIQTRMARWVGAAPNSYVKLEDRAFSIYQFVEPVSTYDAMQKLKSELLESLSELQAKIPTAQSLEYSGLSLAASGVLQARFEGNANASAAFKSALDARIGTNLKTAPNAAAPRVVFGSAAEIERAAPGVLQALGNVSAGSYKIGVSGQTIVVVGDAAGLQKGAKVLAAVLESSEVVL